MKLGVIQSQFEVTETQKLIVAKAFEAVTQKNADPQDPLLADLARIFVVIQSGAKDSYFRNGLEWSFRSRASREPMQVIEELQDLRNRVEIFNLNIDDATGEGARRIRGNRARRLRAAENERLDLDHNDRIETVGYYNVYR